MSLFTELLESPYKEDVVFLVEMQAYDLDASNLVDLYLSSNAFTSSPADTVPNQFYDDRIQSTISFTRSMYNQGQVGGKTFPGFGVIEFINTDGALDAWENYAFDSRSVIIRMGRQGWAVSDFGTIFTGTAESIEFNDKTISLRLRDNQYKIDRPIQTAIYAGTGGWDGGTDLEGKPLPICLGEAYNIKPILLDAANLRYQFHDGQVSAVTRVLDAGIALTLDNDYANEAALDAATISAGYYATCLAEGKMKLGSSPSGVVTMDVLGHASGGYVSTASDLVTHILVDRMGVDSGDLNSASFAALESLTTAALSYYTTDPVSAATVIDDLINSVGGFWGNNRAGEFIVGRFDLPSGTAVATYTADEILSIEKLAVNVPYYQADIGYQPLWQLMSETDLAGGVTDADKEFLTQENRRIIVETSSTLTAFPSSQPLQKNTLLASNSDAATEAVRINDTFSVLGKMYRIKIKSTPLQRDINEEIEIVYNRYNMDSGKNFIIVTMTEDVGADIIELEVYGT